MKRCPECRRDYYDDTLLYCLEDGSALVQGSVPSPDEPATAVLSGQEAPTKPFVTGTGETRQAVSSAEYIVREIRNHKAAALVGAGLLLVGVIAGAWWISGRGSSKTESVPPKEVKFEPLTSGGKVGDEPIIGGTTISPDGKFVVFWTNAGPGKWSIWLRQASTNSLQRIWGPFDAEYSGSTLSRNGEMLYFVSADKANPQGALFQIPILGGVPPRRILEWVSSPVTFSPDEKEMAFVRQDLSKGESSLVIANADGSGTPRTIATRKFPEYFATGGPSWSPDGKVIACGAGTIVPSIQASLVEVPAHGGVERTIASGRWSNLARVLWLPDGSGLVANGSANPGAIGTQIWHVSYPEGDARKITNNLVGYGEASLGLTADGNTIATVLQDSSRPIFAIAPNEDPGRARQISHGKHEGKRSLDMTPDGRIVYIDPSPEGNEIWIMNGDGRGKQQLTNDGFTKALASVSPDGRFIAFTSNRSGSINNWRMDIDGGNVKQLTYGTFDDTPLISPDGKWVVFISRRSGTQTLWKVPIGGGEPVQLSDKPAWGASISPDGKLIACILEDEAQTDKIGLLQFEGGEVVKTLDRPSGGRSLVWKPDGSAVTYLDNSSGATNIFSQPLDGGPAKQLTNFKSDKGYDISNFAWTRDGKQQLIYSRGPFTIDILLIKDFR